MNVSSIVSAINKNFNNNSGFISKDNLEIMSWEECYIFNIAQLIKENYTYFSPDIVSLAYNLDVVIKSVLKTKMELKACKPKFFGLIYNRSLGSLANLPERVKFFENKLISLQKNAKKTALDLKEKFRRYYEQLDEKEQKIYIKKMLDKKWRTLLLINNLFKNIK